MNTLHRFACFSLVAGLVCAAALAFPPGEKPPRGQGGGRGGGQGGGQGGGGGRGGGGQRSQDAPLDDVRFIFRTEVPAHPLDVVLGRPTANAVTASVLSYAEAEGEIEFGPKGGTSAPKTLRFALKAGTPSEVEMAGLPANSTCVYRLKTRAPGGEWKTEPERAFHTARPPGSAFTFTMQADSHLDYNTDPAIYLRCLANALADQPDFLIDLGDTFMTDKHRGRETAAAQYVAQRYYFGQIAHSVPLFLALGNHDGEAGRWLDGGTENLAVWSNARRKRYFPNPVPNGFYTGNGQPDPQAGLLQDYYAWEWGDALFVVLDPFWFTSMNPRSNQDNWSRTLGRAQYDWLASTLEKSHAKFRFVFLHHLVGGLGKDARGGAESAPLYEWGGHEADGTERFKEKRPGWPMSIHALLVKHHVNAVFHGHDHLYARQELDGIVYQAVPQPGHPRDELMRSAAEYGYVGGVLLGSSGHLRVRVEAGKATVEYVRAYLPAAESETRRNGAVSQRYELAPR